MTTTRETRASQSPFAPSFGSFFDSTPYTSLCSDWWSELTMLHLSRLGRYATLPADLMRCRSADDLEDVQDAFFGQLVSDYGNSAKRLNQIARSGLEDVTGDDATEYSATLLKAQEDAAKILKLAKDQAAHIIANAEKVASAELADPGEKKVKAA